MTPQEPALMAPPINIYSGEEGLGASLTNPTELARHKGKLTKALRVTYAGKLYPDAEAAYQANKCADPQENDRMMVEVLCAKLRQHPNLAREVEFRGGAAWLATCSHVTGAQSESAKRWEGAGLESRFIRNLVAAWEAYVAGDTAEHGQPALF